MEKSNINPTSIRLRKDLFEKIKKDAEKDKRSITKQIEYMLEKYYVLLSLAFIDLFTPQYSFHFYPL